jgi:hypothetical protein
MAQGPRVLYHAVGGGLGHGMRALALARQLARQVGGKHRVIVNTPFAAALAEAARGEAGVEWLVAAGGRNDIQALLWEQVRLYDPDLWVIDTLPRGVVGELVPLLEGWSGCPRILIARPLKDAYVRDCRIEAWVGRHYDLVLIPGEHNPLRDLPGAVFIPPFMIRDRDELPARAEALALLNASEAVVLIAGTGTEDECREWAAQAHRLAARWPDDAPPLRLALPPGIVAEERTAIRHSPLIECLPGVRLLIGNAGYHLVHEARHVGVPGLFRPRPRRYDEQAKRLRTGEVAGEELLEQVVERLRQPSPPPADATNGAKLAAQRIAEEFF